jgi:hypothetical protein
MVENLRLESKFSRAAQEFLVLRKELAAEYKPGHELNKVFWKDFRRDPNPGNIWRLLFWTQAHYAKTLFQWQRQERAMLRNWDFMDSLEAFNDILGPSTLDQINLPVKFQRDFAWAFASRGELFVTRSNGLIFANHKACNDHANADFKSAIRLGSGDATAIWAEAHQAELRVLQDLLELLSSDTEIDAINQDKLKESCQVLENKIKNNFDWYPWAEFSLSAGRTILAIVDFAQKQDDPLEPFVRAVEGFSLFIYGTSSESGS